MLEDDIIYTTQVIDPKTGEIQDAILLRPRQKYIRNKNQDRGYLKKLKENEQKNNKHWVASFHEPIKRISQLLDEESAGTLMILMLYLNFEGDGLLENGGTPLTQEDIQILIHRKRTVTYHILKTLQNNGVMRVERKGKNNHYYINSEFHAIGKQLKNDFFTKVFKEKTKEILERISLAQAGMLYKLLPYFHFQSYYLCSNADEDLRLDPNKSFGENLKEKTLKPIQHMEQNELAQLLQIERTTLYRWMNELNEQGILLIEGARKEKTFLMRPDVFFRTKGEDPYYTAFVQYKFDQLDDKFEKKNKRKRKNLA